MMDDELITREDAINAINRIWDRCEEIEAHLPKGDPDKTGYKMITDYLTVWKYLFAQPEQQWTLCSERLPSEGENVLLCDARFGNVAIGRLIRYNTSCCWEVDHWDCDIEDWQAWMPLPKPCKRGRDE